MIPAYDAIFTTSIPISCGLVGLAALSIVFEREAMTARSLLFSFQFWISPAFFLAYMAASQHIEGTIVIATCLEIFILTIYRILFAQLYRRVISASSSEISAMRGYLKIGTWLLVGMSGFLFVQSGAGIFSSGSRNDFVESSRLNLYLVYASLLLQAAMVPMVAAIVNSERRWTRSVVLYLVFVSILSILSASKGGAILTFVAITSLFRFPKRSDYFRTLRIPLLSIAAVLFSTIYFVGRFLSLEPSEFISLMISRIFIANDGRALAIDWSRYLNASSSSLFRESFRFYASFVGTPPRFPPLGQLLYALQFDTAGVVGANTSCTALLITYGATLEKLLFSSVLILIALATGLVAELPGRQLVPRLGISIMLLSLLSQDFLAFQVALHTLVVFSVFLILKTLITRLLREAALDATRFYASRID